MYLQIRINLLGSLKPHPSILYGMILFILLFAPTSNLTFNHNGLDNILYAKGKASTFRNYNAENDVITNNNNKVTQDQKQVTNKVVILTFGDIHKSQFTNVKPILDQYGFKGSFFCTVRYGR